MNVRASILILIGVFALGGYARAAVDDSDFIVAYADVSTVFDSNVFRLADAVPASQYGGSKSDTIIDPRIGFRMNWPLSRQQLVLEAEVSRPSYLQHQQLDYVGWQALAAWDWQLGSDLSGRLSYGDDRSLSEFEDVMLGVKDLVRQQRGDLSAAYALTSNWALLASLGLSEQQHDRRDYLDLRQENASGGVRYRSDLGSELSVSLDYLRVDYLQDLWLLPADERGYRQWMAKLGGVWPLSAKTTLRANYGVTSWKYRFDSEWQRSPTGGLGLAWQASEKTRLYADFQRSFEAPGQNIGRNLLENYRVGANWQATSRTGLELSWRREDKQVRQVLAYSDQSDFWRLGLSYRPDAALQVSLYAQYQARHSQLPGNDYQASQLGIDLKLQY
ncbi:hypothetical protein JHS3_04000 [Jeongeupia sp. HS-3]|uniref:surface lipoprotein assembly modifier n=1 Tax=Jeongeupia sp. HS-3 TaxID=1009682 RepID=UPI0018A45997|nr:surface lipoprotein assembly modifier [Jeongeupia sp. HS-3]BCL74664.1 hypothetical protein JHS3_04000 [Jeongeupia sp. HS-3]